MKSVLDATQAFIDRQQAEIQNADNYVENVIDVMKQAVVEKMEENTTMKKEIMVLKETNNTLVQTVDSLQKRVTSLNLQLDITEQDATSQGFTPPESLTFGDRAVALVSGSVSISVKTGMPPLTLDLSEQSSPGFQSEQEQKNLELWRNGGVR